MTAAIQLSRDLAEAEMEYRRDIRDLEQAFLSGNPARIAACSEAVNSARELLVALRAGHSPFTSH